MKKLTSCAFALALLVATSGLSSAEKPHVHGLAHMNVAIEGNHVKIEVESALASFISFEHEPSTDKEKAEVQAMAATLHDANKLFLFPAVAECKAVDVDLDADNIPDALLASPAGHTKHKKDKHHHGDGKHHHDDDHDAHSHGDLEAEYTFHCDKPEAINKIDVELFKSFPNMHDIDVQLVTPATQKSFKLKPESASITW